MGTVTMNHNIGPAPMCVHCQRFEEGMRGVPFRCEAYPDGIPEAIISQGADHRNPQPGDHGIRFLMKPGEEAAFAARAKQMGWE